VVPLLGVFNNIAFAHDLTSRPEFATGRPCVEDIYQGYRPRRATCIFMYCLFNDAINSSDCIASNDRIISE
jgi:hypothetical protein